MSDTEKGRIQRDAQLTVASRRTRGSARADQAILRHLGVVLYRERRRSDPSPSETDTEEKTPESPNP